MDFFSVLVQGTSLAGRAAEEEREVDDIFYSAAADGIGGDGGFDGLENSPLMTRQHPQIVDHAPGVSQESQTFEVRNPSNGLANFRDVVVNGLTSINQRVSEMTEGTSFAQSALEAAEGMGVGFNTVVEEKGVGDDDQACSEDDKEENSLLSTIRSHYRTPRPADDTNAADVWDSDWVNDEFEDEDEDPLSEDCQQQQDAEAILKEKRNQVARDKKVDEFREAHDIRCSNGQQFAALLKEDPTRGVVALRLVPVLLHELLKLQDDMADIIEARNLLEATGRPRLFDLCAHAVIRDLVPANHISWTMYATAFRNM